MYRKIRFQLTLLFTLVTSILLAALLGISFVWFASSSLSMRVSSFAAQAATVAQDMDEQNVLTVDWLNAKEETSNFGIYLWDNETPFFHNQSHGAPSLPNADYRTAYDFSPVSENEAVFIGRRGLFPEILLYRGQQIRNGGILRFDFLQSMEPFSVYLRRSFLFCLLLYLAASSLLGCFCRYFTGRLLSPLSASQEAQNRFISAASHELRTPLAVILANASACEKAPRSRQKPFFSVIAKEGAQMSDLLEQLLTLSKADAACISDCRRRRSPCVNAILPEYSRSAISCCITPCRTPRPALTSPCSLRPKPTGKRWASAWRTTEKGSQRRNRQKSSSAFIAETIKRTTTVWDLRWQKKSPPPTGEPCRFPPCPAAARVSC